MNGRNFDTLAKIRIWRHGLRLATLKGAKPGVMATVKHFAANNQEYDRHNVSSDVTSDASEIYYRHSSCGRELMWRGDEFL